VHEKAGSQVMADERRDVRAQPLARAQPAEHRLRELGATDVVADERDPPVDGSHGAGEGLGRIVQERTPAQRLTAGEPVGERLHQQRGQLCPMLCIENPDRVGLQGDRAVEHLERVAVDVEMVKAALLYPAQRLQLRQHRGRGPHVAHQLEAMQRERRCEDAAQLHEHALARDVAEAAGMCARRGERAGLGTEAELDRDPHEPQHAQWIVGEGRRAGHAQAAVVEVREPAERVDRRPARERLGDRVDGEVAQRKVGLERAAAQRLDVHLPGVVPCDHAPGSELL
jgi:hypothetical protein